MNNTMEPEGNKADHDVLPPKGKRKPGKKVKAAKKARWGKKAARTAPDRRSKKSEVIAMMKRSKGVTLGEIMEAIGWQRHTVRGFVSVLGNKGGEKIESSQNASGERMYKIVK